MFKFTDRDKVAMECLKIYLSSMSKDYEHDCDFNVADWLEDEGLTWSTTMAYLMADAMISASKEEPNLPSPTTPTPPTITRIK